MKKTIIISLILIFKTLLSYAQSKGIAQIDSILTEMTKQDIFSGTILIADNSKILLVKGYGYADRENKINNTPDTRFTLSSASKVFTGTAITYLAQQGKLKFTDKINQYIAGIPKGNKMTIHQLLTHSAGVDDFFNAKDFSYKNIKNCTDMLPFIRQMPLVYNPGDSCIYSTGNCIVLGAVVEKITGKSFPQYIRETFIEPLGLTNTTFTAYWQLDDSQRQYAVGYKKTDNDEVEKRAYNYDYGFVPLSAGGVWSTVMDIYKFDKAIFSKHLLSEYYLKQMTTRYTSQWENSYFGYMWIINNKKGYESIGHAGDSSGWHATNDYYPKQKYTIIILTNFGWVNLDILSKRFEELLFK
ncbi:serine hydrolase [Emticicia sp. BO119]|uniref:serine hydrolase domain-containing protein n=1 Tax=Emticicia sp. BO119 TaxID=2757768 RepID=UPI0015F0CB66|nr:serine hydrolase domain-containing protein [Emticicia sp. BO119]MBA4850699.1 beta-lactamase family protein [Emticicia sp. BO119]